MVVVSDFSNFAINYVQRTVKKIYTSQMTRQNVTENPGADFFSYARV